MRRRIELDAIPTQESITLSSSVSAPVIPNIVPPRMQTLIKADTPAKSGLTNSIAARIDHNTVAKAILTFIAL